MDCYVGEVRAKMKMWLCMGDAGADADPDVDFECRCRRGLSSGCEFQFRERCKWSNWSSTSPYTYISHLYSHSLHHLDPHPHLHFPHHNLFVPVHLVRFYLYICIYINICMNIFKTLHLQVYLHLYLHLYLDVYAHLHLQ